MSNYHMFIFISFRRLIFVSNTYIRQLNTNGIPSLMSGFTKKSTMDFMPLHQIRLIT